ncbi:MAG: amidohydrolase family protein [bacterium]|nr:amidohydrolase family protein [bacterium]
MIIDFHTHAFPDNIAEKALKTIESMGGIKPKFDGTLRGLLESMDEAGITVSVVLSIATKPSQFESIFRWSRSIFSERIIPFPSVHPDDERVVQHIFEIKNEGFKGLKLHPYFQNFYVDEERMFPIYEAIEKTGLILVMHSGYDFAYERIDRAGPERIKRIIEKFPELKLVAAHLGGWQQWSGVEKFLIGRKVYFETSFSHGFLEKREITKIILSHSPDKILFGSDTPWADQKESVKAIQESELPQDIRDKIFFQNAAELIGIQNFR